MELKLKQVSSLQRVFLDGNFDSEETDRGKAFKNERFSYQIAYRSDRRFFAKISVKSDLCKYITIRSVGNVPSELPCYDEIDENYERTAPGLFPDVLYPIENDTLLIKPYNFYSLWVTAELPKRIKAGEYPITVLIEDEDDEENKWEITFTLNVLDAVLPEQTLKYTQWFHSDCIAQFYGVKPFSAKHWKLIESFVRAAVRGGVNMILTPVFTPPLDTKVGGERLTVQLTDIFVEDGKYIFGFDKLRRWIRLCRRCGIKYFEISHLFSQWGAFAAPKITAWVNGKETKIFGWETEAASDEYKHFLESFIPELIKVIKEEKIEDVTYFHISDEPNGEQGESYKKAKDIVSPLLKDFPIIDALSEYDYYESGLIREPIPGTGNVQEFLDRGYEHRWTYYCCSQKKDLSNRFFGMPLWRTRAIGMPLFRYDMEGFLQWGFNFYNSAHSIRQINPYLVTDADSAFPSGDAFTVYPYENGAIDSVRGTVFYEGLQDMRALQLLEKEKGREEALRLLEDKFGEITFKEYPKGRENITALRELVYEALGL